MTFCLKILGSSSALPTSKRFPTAHALNIHERFFLIDCGEGTQIQLRRYKLQFSRINNIFISHLHGDHFFGLFGLISTFDLLGRKSDLHIYSHPQLEKMFSGESAPLNREDLKFKLVFHHLNHRTNQVLYEDNKVIVESFPQKHRISCWGFIFRENPEKREQKIRKDLIPFYKLSIEQILKLKKGLDIELEDGTILLNKNLTLDPPEPKKYVFCTDTVSLEKNIKYMENADILYHEATYDKSKLKLAKETGHTTAEQAANLAKKANVKQLIIGHFSSRYVHLDILLQEAKTVFEKTILADEGLEINL